VMQLHPVRQAVAQTACAVRTPSTLLGFFSDAAPANSITPSNVRDLLCSVMQLDNDVLLPGCVGNGSTDDTTCVQAAMTAAIGGGTVHLGPHVYAVSTTITIDKESVIGTTNRRFSASGASDLYASGFFGLTANMNVLSVATASIVRDISIAVTGSPTSGSALVTPATAFDDIISDVFIGNACNGLSISGNTIAVDHAMIIGASGSTCYGIVIGAATTGAGTVDVTIDKSNIIGQTGNRDQAGLMIEDSGGLMVTNTNILYSTYGTKIYPTTSQQVYWTYFTNVALGDTTVNAPLYIDTQAATGVVHGVFLTQTWGSNNSTGASIIIQNVGAGSVTGIWFTGHQAMLAPGAATNDVTIGSGVTDVSFYNSHFCGGYSGGNTNGISIASGVTPIAIEDTEISATCGGQGAGALTNAINIAGTTTVATIVGDQLSATNAIVGTLASTSQVANNSGWAGWDAMTYTATGGQSIPSGAVTTLTGWTKVFDRMNANFVASTGVFTAPITGTYGMSAHITFASATPAALALGALLVQANGGLICQTNVYPPAIAAQVMITMPACLFTLSAGQTAILQIYQTVSASALAVATGGGFNHVSIWYVP